MVNFSIKPIVTKDEILEKLKYFNTEESELIKMRFGIGYPNSITTKEMSKILNKDVIALRKHLKEVEKRLSDLLKNS